MTNLWQLTHTQHTRTSACCQVARSIAFTQHTREPTQSTRTTNPRTFPAIGSALVRRHIPQQLHRQLCQHLEKQRDRETELLAPYTPETAPAALLAPGTAAAPFNSHALLPPADCAQSTTWCLNSIDQFHIYGLDRGRQERLKQEGTRRDLR